jgi:energy-coupling factor transporter ATP-binding protein EcfA2
MDPRIRIRTKMSWIPNTALHHFSGELVGVVGAVGTGKSSVLAALLGELEKTGGRIALDRPPQGTRALRRRSWFLFSHCSGPAATRYARSAAGSGFLFSQAVGSVRIPNSNPDPGRPKLPPKRKKEFHASIQA